MTVKVELDIDDDPDKNIIKTMLEAGFKGEDTIFVLGFHQKNYYSMKSGGSEKLVREQFIKPFFEEILINKGENAVQDEFNNIIGEIKTGE